MISKFSSMPVNDSRCHSHSSLFYNADGSLCAYRVREGVTSATMLLCGTLLPLAHSGVTNHNDPSRSELQLLNAMILASGCLGVAVSAFQNLVEHWRNAQR